MRKQKQQWWIAGLAVALVAAGPVLAAQAEPGPEVRTFRFYRAEGNQTRVTAFVEVPYVLLEASPDAMLRYAVTVRIIDASGKQLLETAWPGRARAELRSAEASSMDMLDFSVAPGRYELEVTVQDSVSGRRLVSSSVLEGYQGPPVASDLMLSPAMRLATGSDTMPRQGERRWGNTLVTAATHLILTPVRTRAFYLLEAYADQPTRGTMQVRVVDSTGSALVETRPAEIEVQSGGSVLKGQLDLTGLPSGEYQMAVKLDLDGKVVEKSEPFQMANLQETLDKEAERLAALRETDEGFFAQMGEDQLEAAYSPLGYVGSSDELSVWKTGLSLQAKRKFLTEFWQRRDPSPGTPKNEAREAFYGKIDYANRNFSEGGRAPTPGWKTDRGRVFIKYGEASERLDRRVTGTQSPPYLVWRYTRGKEQYYVFADRSGFGAYKLMYTNDLRETSNPGWREVLGHDAVQDVSRFLGIDLFFSDATSRVPDINSP